MPPAGSDRGPSIGRRKRGQVHETGDAIAAWKMSSDGGRDERRIEKSKRKHHPDRALGLLLTRGKCCQIGYHSCDQFIKPAPRRRNGVEQPPLLLDPNWAQDGCGPLRKTDLALADGRRFLLRDGNGLRFGIRRPCPFPRKPDIDPVRMNCDAIQIVGDDLPIGGQCLGRCRKRCPLPCFPQRIKDHRLDRFTRNPADASGFTLPALDKGR